MFVETVKHANLFFWEIPEADFMAGSAAGGLSGEEGEAFLGGSGAYTST